MITDYEIVKLLYNNILELVSLSVAIAFLLYFQTRKFNLGLSDPINFYWPFTFGTSYAVVIILYFNQLISNKGLFLIVYFYMIFSFFLYLGYKSKTRFLSKRIITNFPVGLVWKSTLFFYTILMVIYLYFIDINTFLLSRFEANNGLGPIYRIIDVIRLFVISSLFISILNNTRSNITKNIFFIFFVIVSSLLTGAKAAIIESIYVVLIIYSITNQKKFRLKFTSWKPWVIIILIILFALYFTNKLGEQMGYRSQYTLFPPAIELLISRIIANGDMYYLGLTNDIIFNDLSQEYNFISLISRPYLGETISKTIFSEDPITIGRSIWLYWYPSSHSGGSTDHFDLAAYSYGGWFSGSLLALTIGYFIGKLNQIKMKAIKNKRKNDFFTLILFPILYLKSYILILSPVVGITSIIDLLFISFILILYLSIVSYLKNQPHK